MYYNHYPAYIRDSVSYSPYNSPYPQPDESEPVDGVEAVYDGSISSSVLNFFSGYYRNHYENQDYLILRDGQYTYRMYVGDIVPNGKNCTVRNCDMITYHSNSGYDFTPYYSVDTGVSAVVDITSGGQLSAYVYSTVVGSCVPDIQNYYYSLATGTFCGVTCIMVVVACLFSVIKGWLTRHDRRD